MLKLIKKEHIDRYLKTGNLSVIEDAMATLIPARIGVKRILCGETKKEKQILHWIHMINAKDKIDKMLKAYCEGFIKEGTESYNEAKNLFECRMLYRRNSKTRNWGLSYMDCAKIKRWIDVYDPSHNIQYYKLQINGIVASMRSDEDYCKGLEIWEYPYEKQRKDNRQVFNTMRFYVKESMNKLSGRGLEEDFIIKITAERVERIVLKLFGSIGIKTASLLIEHNEYNPELYNLVLTTNRGKYTTICDI